MALGYNTLALLRSIALPAAEPVAEAGGHGSLPESAALASHWHLDRVMRQCWEKAGISGHEAWKGSEIAMALLARIDPVARGTAGAKTPGAIGAALILDNYDSSDFRKILGVNRFNDVTWFNKEAFEETLLLVPLFLSMEQMKNIETIAAVADAFQKAKAASGYRLDELPELLSES